MNTNDSNRDKKKGRESQPMGAEQESMGIGASNPQQEQQQQSDRSGGSGQKQIGGQRAGDDNARDSADRGGSTFH